MKNRRAIGTYTSHTTETITTWPSTQTPNTKTSTLPTKILTDTHATPTPSTMPVPQTLSSSSKSSVQSSPMTDSTPVLGDDTSIYQTVFVTITSTITGADTTTEVLLSLPYTTYRTLSSPTPQWTSTWTTVVPTRILSMADPTISRSSSYDFTQGTKSPTRAATTSASTSATTTGISAVDGDSGSGGSHISSGGIAGAAVGAGMAAIAIVGLIVYCYKKHKKPPPRPMPQISAPIQKPISYLPSASNGGSTRPARPPRPVSLSESTMDGMTSGYPSVMRTGGTRNMSSEEEQTSYEDTLPQAENFDMNPQPLRQNRAVSSYYYERPDEQYTGTGYNQAVRPIPDSAIDDTINTISRSRSTGISDFDPRRYTDVSVQSFSSEHTGSINGRTARELHYAVTRDALEGRGVVRPLTKFGAFPEEAARQGSMATTNYSANSISQFRIERTDGQVDRMM